MRTQLSPSALAIRLAVIVLSAATAALIPHASGALYGFVVIGTVVAVVAPNRAGALLVMLADVLGWTSAYGWHGHAPTLRTVVFAIALYLVHAAVALAASVPANAFVPAAVVRMWAWHCVPGVVATVVMGAVLSTLGQPHGSLGLDLVGLAAVLGATAPLLWLARSRR
jgi:hypothetical protein